MVGDDNFDVVEQVPMTCASEQGFQTMVVIVLRESSKATSSSSFTCSWSLW